MGYVNYNLNIPASGNNPSTDQPNMSTNTNAVNTILGVDHFAFNNNSGGTHQQVTLTNEAAPGIPAGTSGVFYANLATSQSWPFWQNALGSFQMLGPQSLGTGGYVNVGGLFIQWGVQAGTHGGKNLFNSGDTGTISFPFAFPSACFGIQANMLWNSATVSNPSQSATIAIDQNPANLTKTSFVWRYPQNSGVYTQFFWLAIGN